jgi:hypothetical protein
LTRHWRVRGQSATKRAKFNRLSLAALLDLLTASTFGNEHADAGFEAEFSG